MAQKDNIVNLILGALFKEQKQRFENGEDITSIIKELDSWQKDKIETSIDKLEPMAPEQYKDLAFLNDWALEVLTLDERLTILKHLRKSGGEITAGELMDMAYDAQEKGVKGGYFEGLTQNSYETGSVDELAGGIILAYRLAQEEESLEDLNAQFMAEQLSKGYAMAAAKLANAVGALVERKLFFTPGKIPGGQQQGATGNSEGSQVPGKLPEVAENYIPGDQQQGEMGDLEASQSPGKPPEAARNPDGQAAGVGEIAKVGDDFGKLGVMVENPSLKADWANTTAHGTERME